MKETSIYRRAGALVVGVAIVSATLPVTTVRAFEFNQSGIGICLPLSTAPYFANVVDSVPGQELVVMNLDETIKLDGDIDGFSEIQAELRVKVVDRSGSVLWTSPVLPIRSPDTATALGDQYFFSTVPDTSSANLVFGGIPCYGSAFGVEAGGSKYMAVSAGFMTQTGIDLETGVDETKINVWILDRDTGAIVAQHNIRPRNDKYLIALSLDGIGLIDGDADDELALSWAIPTGDGRFTILTETYNILTGIMEDRFNAFMRNTRTVELP